MYFYLSTVGFEPTPTSTAAPSNTETYMLIYIYIDPVLELYLFFEKDSLGLTKFAVLFSGFECQFTMGQV